MLPVPSRRPCATRWSSYTRTANASTINMRLTDAQLTVAADMRSRRVRYSWDMLATSTTHHTIMVPMPGVSRIRTPATTAVIPPQAPSGGIDETSCLRLRPVLPGILHHCSRLSLGIGCPTSTPSDRETGCRRHAGPPSFRCCS